MKRVLALDIATVTGFAFGEPDTAPRTGAFRLGGPEASLGEKTFRLMQWLLDFGKVERPNVIFYESPAVPAVMSGRTNINTIRTLMALPGVVEAYCYANAIPVFEESVSTIRNHFLGNNKLKGPDGKKAVFQRCKVLGWDVQSNDAADAAALWHLGCALKGRPFKRWELDLG